MASQQTIGDVTILECALVRVTATQQSKAKEYIGALLQAAMYEGDKIAPAKSVHDAPYDFAVDKESSLQLNGSEVVKNCTGKSAVTPDWVPPMGIGHSPGGAGAFGLNALVESPGLFGSPSDPPSQPESKSPKTTTARRNLRNQNARNPARKARMTMMMVPKNSFMFVSPFLRYNLAHAERGVKYFLSHRVSSVEKAQFCKISQNQNSFCRSASQNRAWIETQNRA